MKWFLKKTYPDYWEDYVASFKNPQEHNLRQIRFVVFDTETTGLNPKTDVILSIGCVAISNLCITVADQFECYLEQSHFNPDTVKIHGLLQKGHLHKTDEVTAIIKFLNFIKNAVLIAHHAAFDVAMINCALKRQGLPKLKNTVIDTLQVFKKSSSYNRHTQLNLDALAERYNIPLHDRHTAAGDAYITALLFLKLVAELGTDKDIILKDLIKSPRIGLL